MAPVAALRDRRGEPPETDDPFAQLLGALDAEDVVRAPVDDRARLRDLFGPTTTPPEPDHAPARVATGGWPRHNFGAAYESVTSDRRYQMRRRPQIGPPALWEVDDLHPEPNPAPAPTPAPSSWESPARKAATADGWLDALAGSPTTARPTEAALVGTLRPTAPRPERVVLDVTQTLFAAPRRRHLPPAAARRHWVRWGATAALALFALAVLQLALLTL